MSNSNCKSNTLNQPVISSSIGQTTVTYMPPVLTKKDNIQQNYTSLSVKRSNEDNSLVEGNVSKKTNTKATP